MPCATTLLIWLLQQNMPGAVQRFVHGIFLIGVFPCAEGIISLFPPCTECRVKFVPKYHSTIICTAVCNSLCVVRSVVLSVNMNSSHGRLLSNNLGFPTNSRSYDVTQHYSFLTTTPGGRAARTPYILLYTRPTTPPHFLPHPHNHHCRSSLTACLPACLRHGVVVEAQKMRLQPSQAQI